MAEINALVPELECRNFALSQRFYIDILGFKVLFERPDSQFSYVTLGDAQIMLKQANGYWETAPLEPPLGRGVNFQITVKECAPLIAALEHAGVALFAATETEWYRTGNTERGQKEFLVQDPDGYLLRFAEFLGERAVTQK